MAGSAPHGSSEPPSYSAATGGSGAATSPGPSEPGSPEPPPAGPSRAHPLDLEHLANEFNPEDPPPYEPPKPAARLIVGRQPGVGSPGVEEFPEMFPGMSRPMVEIDLEAVVGAMASPASSRPEGRNLADLYAARQRSRRFYALGWASFLIVLLTTFINGRSAVVSYPNQPSVQIFVALLVILPCFQMTPTAGVLHTVFRKAPRDPAPLFPSHRPFTAACCIAVACNLVLPASCFLVALVTTATTPQPWLGYLLYADALAAVLGLAAIHVVWQVADNRFCRELGFRRELFCGTCFGSWSREAPEERAERMRAARERAMRLGF
ncbi:hypothetical protein DFJ74DRAFT_679451 [Hyaloraphidium curvatum]|nr:hypothetical protein DFJ74DRAFT_679451 [Hyaloraphidium curvatum]